jgi:hypothetical protein
VTAPQMNSPMKIPKISLPLSSSRLPGSRFNFAPLLYVSNRLANA